MIGNEQLQVYSIILKARSPLFIGTEKRITKKSTVMIQKHIQYCSLTLIS
jgi:hypothetical protein